MFENQGLWDTHVSGTGTGNRANLEDRESFKEVQGYYSAKEGRRESKTENVIMTNVSEEKSVQMPGQDHWTW